MFTRAFWIDAAERCVKTLAQTMIAMLTAGQVIWDVDWDEALGVAATAAVLSLLSSLVSVGRAGTVSPASIIKED